MLKSREVEDPVNLWVNRPLAYGFVALVYRSSLTPNQITALSVCVGFLAAGCFVLGTPVLMLGGGVLLWLSAILDGADGILARARQSFSPLGRVLDGTADLLIGLVTVLAAVFHMWSQQRDPQLLILAPIAIGSAVLHIYLYDFYKESYLQMTDPRWNGQPERLSEVRAQLARVKAEGAGLVAVIACKLYVDLIVAQTWLVARTNPWGSREHLVFKVSEGSAKLYRQGHRGPMQVWALISLAPHSYLMAMCAMFDRLDIYLWLRLIVANGIFLVLLIWQRRRSQRTRVELEILGLQPVAR